MEGEREVTYWIDRAVWGRGVGSRALGLLIETESARPLAARAASSNLASIAVLTKNGFVEVRRETSFAPGVKTRVEETVFMLPEQ